MARNHSGIINLMNIILLLSIPPTMSPASKNEDAVYFLVTALFMADAQGKCVLLDKALPTSVEEIIKEDVLSLLKEPIRNKANIKVVPKPAHLPPFQFKQNTVKLELRKMASRKNFLGTIADGLRNFWDYDIMHKGRGKTKTKITAKFAKPNPTTKVVKAKQVNQTEPAKQVNKTEPAKHFDKTELSHKSLLEKKSYVTKGQPTTVPVTDNHYIPNEIYYSIEKKCTNWSDGCQLKSPPIFEQPSSMFKFSEGVLVPPKFELWDP